MNGSEIANCTSLYVKNVDIMTTDSDLRKAFDQFGPIQSIALRCDRGFAFVYYHTPEPVHAAIKARSEGKVSFFLSLCSSCCTFQVLQVCELGDTSASYSTQKVMCL
jgi:RNA recognition motif-containing protein